MAVVTRSNGDAKGVIAVDTGKGPGVIVATGLTKNPLVLKVVAGSSGARDLRSETVTGGAVETMLRQVAVDSTIVMYQVENDGNGQITVLVEACGSNASVIQDRITGLAANIGAAGNVWAAGVTVSSAGGFKAA